MPHYLTPRLAGGLIFASIGLPALAEPPHLDAGAIERTMPRQETPKPSEAPALQIEEPNQMQAAKSLKFTLRGWKISGASLIPENDLQALIQDYVGREIGLDEMREAARTVAAHFREQGYFVRAFLPRQEIRDGVVEIRLVEGRLGDVKIENPNQVISDERARDTITNTQGIGEPLQLQQLERGILLLHDLPGVDVTPTLKPGSKAGESDLALKVEARPLFNASLGYANTGIRAIGLNLFSGTVAANNAFGIGDQATLLVQGGSGNVFGRIGYSLPVGYSGLRVGVSASSLYYELGNEYKYLDASGDAWTGGIWASYPFVRGSRFNLYGITGFDTRRYHNVSLGAVSSDNTLNVGYVGFNTDYRDKLLGSWGSGFNDFSFTTVIGDVDLSATRANLTADRATARTNGAYQKFNFAFSRLQQLPANVSFWSSFYGQLATRNLNSSEKFSLGGPNGVRAYPVNEALGDEGYLMKFELRYEVYQNVQLIGFIDHGGITLHKELWNGWNSLGGSPNHYTLSGGGVGVNWVEPGNFAINLSVAQRIGSNPGRNRVNGTDNDGSYNTPQFWAQLNKYF